MHADDKVNALVLLLAIAQLLAVRAVVVSVGRPEVGRRGELSREVTANREAKLLPTHNHELPFGNAVAQYVTVSDLGIVGLPVDASVESNVLPHILLRCYEPA